MVSEYEIKGCLQPQIAQARLRYTAATGFCAVLLILLASNYAIDFFRYFMDGVSAIGACFVALFSETGFSDARAMIIPALDNSTLELIFDCVVQILILTIPFFVMSKILGEKFRGALRYTKKSPVKPGLFIPFAIGIGYITNIVFIIIFGEPESGLVLRLTNSDLYNSTSNIVLNYAMVSLIPGIFEEIGMRGTVLRLTAPHGKGFALVVSSVLFGLLHSDVRQMVFAMIMGFLLGFCYLMTESIWFSVLIHVLNNAFALFIGYMNHYGEQRTVTSIAFLMLAVLVLSALMLSYYLLKDVFSKPLKAQEPPKKYIVDLKSGMKMVLTSPMTYVFVVIRILTYVVMNE